MRIHPGFAVQHGGRFATVRQRIAAVVGTVIKMFFRTFKQLLGCRHLLSDKHNGVEIPASCAMKILPADPDLHRQEAEPGDGADGLVRAHGRRQSQGTRGVHRKTTVALAGAAAAVLDVPSGGFTRALSPAWLASAARMARGPEARSERPARGRGQPRTGEPCRASAAYPSVSPGPGKSRRSTSARHRAIASPMVCFVSA